MAFKERPVLFSGAMVRATLDDRKTQTRQLINLNCSKFPIEHWEPWIVEGDRQFTESRDPLWLSVENAKPGSLYREWTCPYGMEGDRLKVAKTSITLEILKVSVQRLQEISEEDAIAEGIESKQEYSSRNSYLRTLYKDYSRQDWLDCPIASFRSLWDSTNQDCALWDFNPWVFAIDFKREVR